MATDGMTCGRSVLFLAWVSASRTKRTGKIHKNRKLEFQHKPYVLNDLNFASLTRCFQLYLIDIADSAQLIDSV